MRVTGPPGGELRQSQFCLLSGLHCSGPTWYRTIANLGPSPTTRIVWIRRLGTSENVRQLGELGVLLFPRIKTCRYPPPPKEESFPELGVGIRKRWKIKHLASDEVINTHEQTHRFNIAVGPLLHFFDRWTVPDTVWFLIVHLKASWYLGENMRIESGECR